MQSSDDSAVLAQGEPSPGEETAPEQDAEAAEFEVFVEERSSGIIRRFFVTYRHFLATLFGGLTAHRRSRRGERLL